MTDRERRESQSRGGERGSAASNEGSVENKINDESRSSDAAIFIAPGGCRRCAQGGCASMWPSLSWNGSHNG